DVLPRYLRQQRWFAAKNEQIDAAVLRDRCGWNTGRGEWLLTTVDARFESGGEQTYFLPLAIAWGAERAGPEHAAALARVRQKADTGLLFDAFAREAFSRDLVERILRRDDGPVGCGRGTLHFVAASALDALAPHDLDEEEVRRPATEGSNSTFLVGDGLFLKAYRRLRKGVNPEWEMGRFLTE